MRCPIQSLHLGSSYKCGGNKSMRECTNLDFSGAINLLESSEVKCVGIFTPTAGEVEM